MDDDDNPADQTRDVAFAMTSFPCASRWPTQVIKLFQQQRNTPCRPFHNSSEQSRRRARASCSLAAEHMQLAVCGLHMRGQKLEHQLTELDAKFVKACRSAPVYRLYAITDSSTGTCRPGMVFVGHQTGKAVDLEVWTLPVHAVGLFLLSIAAPLGLGTVLLEDSSCVKGFICEGYVANLSREARTGQSDTLFGNLDVIDITQYGSWRHFNAQQH